MVCSATVVHAGSGYERYLLKYMVGSVVEMSEHGLALGYFAGGGAIGLKLEAQPIVENDIRVMRLYRGESPHTGEPLRRGTSTVRTYADQKTGKPKEYKPVLALELCFSAPENVSDLFGTAGPETRSKILNALNQSVGIALKKVEYDYCFTRTGEGGKNREPANPIFACFNHFTSRSLEPQLHTHVQMMSTVIRHNTKGGALDTRALLKRDVVFELGQVFRDALKQELSKEFPYFEFPSVPIKNGTSFGITGIPESLSKAFSSRRSRIEEGLKEIENPTSKQVQKVVLETRQKKPENISPKELFAKWRAVGAEHDFKADEFEALAKERYLTQRQNAKRSHTGARDSLVGKNSKSTSVKRGDAPFASAARRLKDSENQRSLAQKLKESVTPEWLRPIDDIGTELIRARRLAAKRYERLCRKITLLYALGQVSRSTYERCIYGKYESRSKAVIEFKFFTGQIKLSERLYLWEKNRHGDPRLGVPKSRAFINLYAAIGNITRSQQIKLLEFNGHIRAQSHSHSF